MSVRSVPPTTTVPTAHTLRDLAPGAAAGVPDTLLSWLFDAPGIGLGWKDRHWNPFQCSRRLWATPWPSSKKPLAHASQDWSVVTPNRTLTVAPGFGGCPPSFTFRQPAAAAPGARAQPGGQHPGQHQRRGKRHETAPGPPAHVCHSRSFRRPRSGRPAAELGREAWNGPDVRLKPGRPAAASTVPARRQRQRSS